MMMLVIKHYKSTLMNWKRLTSLSQIEHIKEESHSQPILIFKHSTRCSTSAMVLSRMERNWNDHPTKAYFLDLISYREISNLIANEFQVEHESPQVLLIKGGRSVYDASHMAISVDEIIKHAE